MPLKTEPAIPALDNAALAYADAIAGAPRFDEAAAYYSSDGAYVADHLKRGKSGRLASVERRRGAFLLGLE